MLRIIHPGEIATHSVGILSFFLFLMLPAPGYSSDTSGESAYFTGSVSIYVVDGRERGPCIGNSRLLLRRTLFPRTRRITEEIIMDGKYTGFEHRRVEIQVHGESLTLREKNGNFRGSGRLHGQPWKWTEWVHIYEMRDGSREVLHVKQKGKSLHSIKQQYGPDGNLYFIHEAELDEVDEIVFEEARANILARSTVLSR